MTLPLRARFAALSAALVLFVGAVAGLAGYLSFRASLLGHAAGTARSEAARLAGLVDGAGTGADSQAVDLTDPSLTRQLAGQGLLVEVTRSGGSVIQASPSAARAPALRLPDAPRARCLTGGRAVARLASPPLAVACARVGPARAPRAMIIVGAPLRDSLASLAALRRTLIIGVIAGGLLAALLSLLLARRALSPLKRIATTARSIRSGDLSQRIGYRGRDELGELAGELDACFTELETALERQRSFTADASHELKTPLAAIRAHAEVLHGWAGADPAARDTALASLDQATRRASRLVADLLVLARLDRPAPRPRHPVGLDDVVVAAVREAAPLRGDVAIRIERLDEAVVAGDAIELQQLLLNLLDNGLKASPPGAEVTVTLAAGAEPGGRARVEVADRGPGIPPQELERIFDRFYARGAGGGAGLGLAIARSIARAHGGELVARNRDGGAGATFELRLPPPAGPARNPAHALGAAGS